MSSEVDVVHITGTYHHSDDTYEKIWPSDSGDSSSINLSVTDYVTIAVVLFIVGLSVTAVVLFYRSMKNRSSSSGGASSLLELTSHSSKNKIRAGRRGYENVPDQSTHSPIRNTDAEFNGDKIDFSLEMEMDTTQNTSYSPVQNPLSQSYTSRFFGSKVKVEQDDIGIGSFRFTGEDGSTGEGVVVLPFNEESLPVEVSQQNAI